MTARPRPVFVLGSPRSGTTALGALLETIPGVCHLGEYCAFDFTSRIAPSEMASLPSPVVGGYLEELRAHARDYADRAARESGADAFCDSGPWNLLSGGRIAAANEDAVFVCCVRNVRGVVQSLARSYAAGRLWAGATTAARVALWARFYRNVADLPPARTHFFDFDGFSAEPAGALERLREALIGWGLRAGEMDLGALARSHATGGAANRPTAAERTDSGAVVLRARPSWEPDEWTAEDEAVVAGDADCRQTQQILLRCAGIDGGPPGAAPRPARRLAAISPPLASALDRAGVPRAWVEDLAEPLDRVFACVRELSAGAGIWLHGSRAIGTHRESSDLDITVVLEDDAEVAEAKRRLAEVLTYEREAEDYFVLERCELWLWRGREIGLHFWTSAAIANAVDEATRSPESLDARQAFLQHVIVEGRSLGDDDRGLASLQARVAAVPGAFFDAIADRYLALLKQKRRWWRLRPAWKGPFELLSDLRIIVEEIARAHYALNNRLFMPGSKEYDRDCHVLLPRIDDQFTRILRVDPGTPASGSIRDALERVITELERYRHESDQRA